MGKTFVLMREHTQKTEKNTIISYMIKTHKNKIILLAVISLLMSGFLPYVFNNSKELEKGNLVSHAQLCCCGTGANTCQDCCCAKDFGEDDTDKHLVIITSCGGRSDVASFSPELNYVVSLSPIIYHLPFTATLEPITLRPTNSSLVPPYKPPRA
ncbi:MAG: hypothetical protein ACYSR0_12220 [Planctomycetota bacterium]|jgi:hypothetical protein